MIVPIAIKIAIALFRIRVDKLLRLIETTTTVSKLSTGKIEMAVDLSTMIKLDLFSQIKDGH